MKQSDFSAMEAYMLSHAGDACHAPGHIYRVLGTALALADSEPTVDRDILAAACLLHDVGRPEQFRTGADHALVGGDMAYDFLLTLGWEPARAEWVRQCIRAHRFRNDLPPETVEAKLLYDADKMDVLGPIGIARTIQYGTAMGEEEPLYRLDREGHILTGADGDPSFFQEYDRKLRGISGKMLTPQGREMAQSLQEQGDRFYDALLSQLQESLDVGRAQLTELGLQITGGA